MFKSIIYSATGQSKCLYSRLKGDGITDDSLALQYIVDNSDVIKIPDAINIRLTRTINIDIAKLKMFDGGNSIFTIEGNIPAFNIFGSCDSGTADPSTQTEKVLNEESGFIFRNAKIIGRNKYNS